MLAPNGLLMWGSNDISKFISLLARVDLWWGHIEQYIEFGSIFGNCIWATFGMGVYIGGFDHCNCNHYNGIAYLYSKNFPSMDGIPHTSIVSFITCTCCSFRLYCGLGVGKHKLS